MQKRILSLLVLLMTAATGAWADETLLLTIESKDYASFKSGSKTFDDKVTITFSSSVRNDGDTDGWFGSSVFSSLLTVTGTNGYTITSCKFYTAGGTANTGYTVEGESPSVYLSDWCVFTDANKSVNIGEPGVKKIEVYTASAASGYGVSLKSSTEDASNWQGKAGTGDYQSMPLEGVAANTAVNVKYSGTKMVKSVKAKKKAAAPAYPMASEATAADYGKVVCAAGHLHDAKTAVPDGCTAVAVFAYIDGGNNRYGIALQDAENASWNTITNNGANNNTLCGVPGTWTVTAPTDASWFVGTKAIYEAIFINLGSTTGDEDGTTYDGNVNDYITAAGGTAISWLYSTTTVINEGESWDFGTGFWGYADLDNNYKVRPVLGFGGEAAEQAAEEPVTVAVPMTIEAITAGSIIVANPKAGMQFSLDGGKTKNAVTTDAIPVAAGDKVQFYGEDTNITGYGSYDMSECTMINGWGDGFTCKVYGNIMSLLDEKNFATATTLSGSYTFNSLFSRNRTLTDASGLLLPATQLAESCYMQMFYKCTALAAAPALPATQLQESCYREMFYGCDALTAAPVLPAKELVRLCYYAMFTRCVKLASVTCLATEGINEMNSTSDWLDGAGLAVQGTKTVNTFSTANWPEGDNGIPTDWTRVNIDN